MEVMNEINPNILCLLETYLHDADVINIQRYRIYRVNRDSKGDAIMLPIKKELYRST